MGNNLLRNTALCLQVLAGLATIGLYFRLTNDLKLPNIFLCLPLCLVALPFITRFTNVFNDLSSRETVTGVLTGVTCSFVSVVGSDNKVQLIVMSPWTEQYFSPWMTFLRCLELLYIPLLMSVILISFLASVHRMPTTAGVATAAATAFSADFTIVTCYVMLRSDDIRGSEVIANILLLIVPFFLISLMPLFRDKPRAWLFSLVLLLLIFYWEVIFIGTGVWSWKKRTFPIPACLAAVVFVFHSAHLDVDKMTQIRNAAPQLIPTSTYQKGHQKWRLPTAPLYNNHLSAGLIWHCLSYGVERLALYRIFNEPGSHSDCVIVCFVLALFALVMSEYMDGSKTRRMVMITLLLLSFILVTMKNHMYKNSYALDMLLGMSMTCITDVW